MNFMEFYSFIILFLLGASKKNSRKPHFPGSPGVFQQGWTLGGGWTVLMVMDNSAVTSEKKCGFDWIF
jgi:hypothetical protein